MPTEQQAAQKLSLTKVIATVGPACSSQDMLTTLAKSGVSIFRLNFSHGSLEDHQESLHRIRSVEAQLDRPLGVIGDLSGPKMRVGEVAGDGVFVEVGQDVVFQREPIVAQPAKRPVFSSTYDKLVDEVQASHRLLINDGAIRLLVVDEEDDALICRVMVGGIISSGKGINLPNTELSAPALTEKDWKCVDWAIAHEVDMLAMSFVRRPEDLKNLKAYLETNQPQQTIANAGGPIPLIAKIERPEAMQNIDAIIQASDAVMVARGDLGVEMDLAEVPVIQKQILRRCRYFGRPCIVATQMLQSMIDNPVPTRAEASDVANAIYDGADAVMLSGETAVGAHPDLAVSTMERIALNTEEHYAEIVLESSTPGHARETADVTAALAHAAWQVARDVRAKLVVCWSELGGSAQHLSQQRFHIPIVALSQSLQALRRMALLRCVTPKQVEPHDDSEALIFAVESMVEQAGWGQRGDIIIVVAGMPVGATGRTDRVIVHRIGESR